MSFNIFSDISPEVYHLKNDGWKTILIFRGELSNFQGVSLRAHPRQIPLANDGKESLYGHSVKVFQRCVETSLECSFFVVTPTPWKIDMVHLQITHLERKMIFQTSMIMFHVNLPGCKGCNSEFPSCHFCDVLGCTSFLQGLRGLAKLLLGAGFLGTRKSERLTETGWKSCDFLWGFS